MLQEHNPDQQRAAINLENAYSNWIEADRQTQGSYLRWKTVNSKDYLCRIQRGTNHETSLGPRSQETEQWFAESKEMESIAQNGEKRLLVLGRLYKATDLPVIETFAGNVLRALDRHEMLGDKIQVIGTNAIVAYQMEAQHSIDQTLMMTEDFDLAWRGNQEENIAKSRGLKGPASLFDVIKETDSTWTVSMEHTFRLMNNKLQMVELLIPPSLLKFAPKGKWRAVELESQEDLIGGYPVEHVVADLSGKPARIIAPDPRLFALHKWNLSFNPERKPTKQTKDRKQALEVKALIDVGMTNHPFDDEFLDNLKPHLKSAYDSLIKYEDACKMKGIHHSVSKTSSKSKRNVLKR